jgi:molybdopterin-guanine dinucleotide biosynthesis protein A
MCPTTARLGPFGICASSGLNHEPGEHAKYEETTQSLVGIGFPCASRDVRCGSNAWPHKGIRGCKKWRGSAYHQPVDNDNIAAFVLAGGKSSRMRKDKAFLELGGRTLLSRALELAGSVAGTVAIVGDGTKFFPLGRVVEDVFPGQGPLAGIHAALSGSDAAFNLMLAVDMPFLERNFLLYLLSEASRGGAIATVPKTAHGWQSLCAVYRREFAATAERALRSGRNKIDPLFAQVETRVVSEQEMLRMNFSESMF